MELCITHGSIFFEAKTEAALRRGGGAQPSAGACAFRDTPWRA